MLGLKSRFIVLVFALVAVGCYCDDVDLKNPVRSAAEDEITSLPGMNYTPNFKHYSGYLEADEQKPTNRFWHYWFVESQSDPANDPLVLWLNGGPGCSSLLGLLTELGPYSVSPSGQIKANPFAWNQKANVIFMESPAGVGFSYAVDGSITADDDTTAEQNHAALRSFLRKFPQFKGRPLYLTGESYAGVYLPTLAVLVDEDKEMNLKGVAIGNGYLDANKLAESLVYFSYYHGLFGKSVWNGLSTHCCEGKPPARGDCKFIDPSRSNQCSDYVAQVTDSILDSGLNPYNLYDKCAQPSQAGQMKQVLGREHFERSILLSSFNVTEERPPGWYKGPTGSQRRSVKKFQISVRGDPPCTNDNVVINYLNRKDVKTALHIPQGLSREFTTCLDNIQYKMIYPGREGGLAPQINKLISSPRKLTLLVYNGDVDMMCNFFGDEWFVDDLGRKVIADYAPWHVNDQVAGFVKHYEGITYMTVKGSGHMVPTDRPQEALHMFNIFLYGHKKEEQL